MAEKDLHGVGGWLLFFVVLLLVLSPLRTFLGIMSDISGTEHQYPQLVSLTRWNEFKQAYWSAGGLSIALVIGSGLLLCYSRSARAVTFTQIAIWIAGPVSSLFITFVLPPLIFDVGMQRAQVAESLGTVLASVFWAAIWTVYLARSKRVKNTYGGPSALPANVLDRNDALATPQPSRLKTGLTVAGGSIGFILLLIVQLAFSAFQFAAITSGLEHWLDWSRWVCVVVAGVFVFWLRVPLLTIPLGVVGAHYAWHWGWLQSILLFFGPGLLLMAISLAIGAGSKALRW